MAFHQPTAPPRASATARPPSPSRPALAVVTPPAGPADSQEWVLFSPAMAQRSRSPSAVEPGSRLSDFGSLNTIGRDGVEALSDTSDLDSLDDGLHAFREPSPYQTVPPSPRRWADPTMGVTATAASGAIILPAHDGLGSFAPSSSPVQDALWGLERHNPRRQHPRATSATIPMRAPDEVDDDVLPLDDQRLERIQRWRIEQSQILEEAVEEGVDFVQPLSPQDTDAVINTKANDLAGAVVKATSVDPAVVPGLWQRITRTVMRNLIGLDDRLLATILGEELIDERAGLAAVRDPTIAHPPLSGFSDSHADWETRLVRRIARELGQLVSSIAPPAPRALPAPVVEPASLDYAGMPIPPIAEEPPREDARSERSSGVPSAAFRPTLAPLDEAGTADGVAATAAAEHAEREYWEQTPDLGAVLSYLARRFVSSRRGSGAGHVHAHPHSHSHSHTHPHGYTYTRASIATAHTPASLHRAHLISQQHPLLAPTTRPSRHRRRASVSHPRHHLAHHSQHTGGLGLGLGGAVAAPTSSLGLNAGGSLNLGLGMGFGAATAAAPSLKRAGTSCASVSTKRSRRAGSDAASRNYWDLGAGAGGPRPGSSSDAGFAWMGAGGWGEV